MNARVFFAVAGVWLAACGGATDDPKTSDTGADGGTSAPEEPAAVKTVSGAVECNRSQSSHDDYIQSLENKPCEKEDDNCDSNNGCGGCFLKCVNHVWTANGEQSAGTAHPKLCYSIGNGC